MWLFGFLASQLFVYRCAPSCTVYSLQRTSVLVLQFIRVRLKAVSGMQSGAVEILCSLQILIEDLVQGPVQAGPGPTGSDWSPGEVSCETL